MTNKEKYRIFCKKEKEIPIFSKDYWLDSVCGENNWDVAIVEKENQIIASLPYYLKKILFFKVIAMPVLTPNVFLFMKKIKGEKKIKKISRKKNLIQELISQIPSNDSFIQCYTPTLKNWLPFYWKGYKQTTHYTYILYDISNMEKIFSNFSYSKRRSIIKASKIVTIHEDLDSDVFYERHKRTLKEGNKNIFYTKLQFEKIYKVTQKNKCSKILYAKDKYDNIHVAIFFVWDNNNAYFLMSSIDQKFKKNGSSSFLMYKVIEYASKHVNRFDFEGSMIKSVEFSYRNFGGKQVPYFCIYKNNSKIYSILLNLKKKFK